MRRQKTGDVYLNVQALEVQSNRTAVARTALIRAVETFVEESYNGKCMDADTDASGLSPAVRTVRDLEVSLRMASMAMFTNLERPALHIVALELNTYLKAKENGR